jgi:uncharacterized HhH-GPD family protein
MASMTRTLHLVGEPEADKLLSEDPLALLLGMLLDQQVAMEVAFNGPKKIADRMGGLDAVKIAEYDPEQFVELCVAKPAIHRYGGSMGKRVQAVCQFLVEHYDGRAEGIWTNGKPDGKEVLRRLKELPGFGEQKSKIFLALLGKQIGARPKGWREVAGAYGEKNSRRSIADVVDEKTLGEVRAFKKSVKAQAAAEKES